ncbi:M13 family metallopeptidase [Mucilaginibacter sp. L3T2-6]|uniref:M13 family metallopeptidase n=1 Tax=Mucilaginibacter sp. L3T2-6 TaxID=3062491 RepID=UPI0026744BF5|nr:M13 family metallopeptidase [Mucilaginibacter sp. L3T2-6]MDO3641530.1 M13 family metallopeptidase [Mucilaginibacter sp. L3T2-6]MDV6214024.1 M13 family metallopeptidase [Mucilaginibacter sp. L3T2-6]
MRLTKYLLLTIPVITVAGCSQPKTSSTEPAKRTVFFDKSGMDTTVNPGDNFFLYANGKWIKDTKIPPSENSWGLANMLFNDNQKHLHQILEDVGVNDNPQGSKEQKVADFYKSGMDTVTIEKLGYEPVKPLLAKIDAVADYKELVTLAAAGFKDGGGFLFGFYVAPDDRIANKNVVHFDQTGLTLDEKGSYLKTDSASVNIRKEYVKYIAKLFTLTGVDAATATAKANGILKLETEIARSHLSPEELRDPVRNYNKFTSADFQKQVPDIDLGGVFNLMGLKTDTVLVGQPGYYKALDGLLKSQPIAVWKDKAAFGVLNDAATALSKRFVNAHFDFYGKVLNGQKVQKERWKKMVDKVDDSLGDLLGQLYVEKYFPADAKKRMLSLVNNLLNVYRDRIQKLDWMGPETKQRALDKLNAITKKIGYPDKWKNYDDVVITKDTYYKNLQAIARHNYNESVKKINKPVDKTEWGMTSPTINASYNPAFNDITFPAGILQWPFFDNNADDAINYGAIGLVIGHEMTHGFDDQGRQYDKDGNLKDWWTKEDAAKFNARVKVVIDEYNKYTVLDTLHLNGNLTQGENLADIGGLAIAYQAFKNTPEGKSNTKIDGLTPDQRFFLSCAQVWRAKRSDQLTRRLVSIDPHSPPMYRVNGPVSNMQQFYDAFGIKPGAKMYREDKDRVKVW